MYYSKSWAESATSKRVYVIQNRRNKRIRRKNRIFEIKLFILICMCCQALFIYGLMTATTLR